MIFLDQYIFLLMIFSPLAASFFITLIPATDTGSKQTVSRFFALMGFAAFTRVLVIYLDQTIQTETALSLSVINFNISLTILLTKYNIFLYGAAASSLLVNIFLYDVRDTKTNIHQVAPFLLTFFLYVSFGQGDLRVALPLLSIANFLVYFLIGFAEKIRRGTTIFRMGIFLFACDALALVLMQAPFSEHATPGQITLINALLFVPGFTRLGLPLFAPFIKKLLLNVDAREGPFLIVFLELAGYFVLIMAKHDGESLPKPLTMGVICIGTVSALYIALRAVIDDKIHVLPYYFLLFYTTLTSISLFFVDNDSFWPFSITMFLTNIACFFVTTYIATIIGQFQAREMYSSRLAPLWLFTLSLVLGLPGLGMGTSLWALVYRFLSFGSLYQEPALHYVWIAFFATWFLGLLLLSGAAIKSVTFVLALKDIYQFGDSRMPIRRSLMLGPVAVAAIALLIPSIIFYAKLQGF